MIINTQNTDFEEILADIQDILKTKYGFTDVDFDGSNITAFTTILAYVKALLQYNLNVGVNELISLQTAQLRKNVAAKAKGLSYTPRRPVGANSVLSVELTDVPQNVLDYEGNYALYIPQDTIFQAGAYEFRTTEIVTLAKDGSRVYGDVYVRQLTKDPALEIAATPFDADEHSVIRIKSFDIDESSLAVYVKDIADEWELWSPDSDMTITEIGPTTQVYFVSEYERGLEIRFGDDKIGARPQSGIDFKVEFYLTDGVVANNLSNFTMTGPEVGTIEDNLDQPNTFLVGDFQVNINQKSQGGADIESSESIRRNAPRSYASQERAVTRDDYYDKLTSGRFTTELGFTPATVSVWGGDQHIPRNLGAVYVSMMKDNHGLLTDEEKEQVKNYLRQFSIITFRHEVIDPEFIYASIRSKIRVYNNADVAETRQSVLEAITSYMDSIEQFGSSFKKSNLISDIDAIFGVSSNSFTSELKYRLRGADSRRYYKYLMKNITPGSISAAWKNNTITDDGLGRLFYGLTEIGNVDYNTGAIFMILPTSVGIIEDGQVMDISFEVDNDDFDMLRNLILLKDSIYVNVERLSTNG